MSRKRCIIICGQTATGKSDLAVVLAQQYSGEIISCDSRQIYRGLDIGSNKIKDIEMHNIPHYMLDSTDTGSRYTVADFQTQARQHMLDIWSRGKTPILCGGTGLYIYATIYDRYIFDSTQPPQLPDNIHYIWIGLCCSREILLPRIRARAESHMNAVVAEITALLDQGVSHAWLHKLGLEYKYGIELYENTINESEYTELLTTKTWQYARRQMIWLRPNTDILWNPTMKQIANNLL
jgi:tRNA dimethylallyltransferase